MNKLTFTLELLGMSVVFALIAWGLPLASKMIQ